MPEGVKQIDPNSGASEQGSHRDGSDGQGHANPDLSDYVRKERFDQVNGRYHALQREVATMQGRLDEISKGGQSDEPVRYSSAQLDQAVEEGRVTREKADEYLEAQQRADIERTVQTTVEKTMRREQRSDTIADQILEYQKLVPEAYEDGDKAQVALQKESDYQIKTFGLDPSSPATDLAVLRARYGPLESLRAAKRGDGRPESHPDTGSDRGGGSGEQNRKDGSPKGLPLHLREHYESAIGKGVYKGWDDPDLQKEVGQYGKNTIRNSGARAA